MPILAVISSCETSVSFFFLNRRSSSSLRETNFGSCWSKLPRHGLPRPAQGVLQPVRQDQLFLADLGELEDDVFQSGIEQGGRVRALFEAFLQIEQVQMIAGFAVQQIQLLEVKVFEQGIIALEADDIVEASGVRQGFFDGQHGFPILNLADLVGEDSAFSVLNRKSTSLMCSISARISFPAI